MWAYDLTLRWLRGLGLRGERLKRGGAKRNAQRNGKVLA
jgi:hypothetical protein